MILMEGQPMRKPIAPVRKEARMTEIGTGTPWVDNIAEEYAPTAIKAAWPTDNCPANPVKICSPKIEMMEIRIKLMIPRR